MALDVTTNRANISYRNYMGSDQQQVEAKLFSEKMKPIAKIMCTKITACPEETEVLNGEARYQAKVRFELIYMSEDGQFYTVIENVYVNSKIENPLFNTNVYALTSSDIVDSNIVSVQPDMVTISAIVESRIEGIVNEEVSYVENANSTIVAKKEVIPYCNMVAGQKTRFKVTDEFETKEEMAKLLMANVNLCNQEVLAGENYIAIKGVLNVTLTYETGGEQNQIKSLTQLIDFKEEIEAPGVKPESIITFIASVRQDEVNIFGNNVDGTTILKASIGICYNYAVLEKATMDAVIDAFSVNDTVNLSYSSFTISTFYCTIADTKKITDTVLLEENQAQIDKIEASCGGDVYVANAYCVTGFVMIEGVARVNIIYYTMNEEEQMYESTLIEVPYAIQLACSEIDEESGAIVKVNVRNVALSKSKKNELELAIDLCAYAQVCKTTEEAVVSKIEESDMPQDETCALKMFMVKKESTLWDACKQMNATPDMIMEQNDVTFPLEKDVILVIYKQKQEEY